MTKRILLTFTYLTLSFLTFAQSFVVKGKVVNATQQPLSKASVICKKNTTGKILRTTTAENGEFQFMDLTKGEYELQVEYIGYALYKSSLKLEYDNKELL